MSAKKAAPRTIAEAIKQTRPFRSRVHEAVVSLLRTANVLERRLDAATLVEGISGQQYNILRILRGAAGPLPTMEISERLVQQTPGITGLLDRLETKGLIRRERCAEDRRRVLCQATREGLAVLKRLEGPVAALDRSTTEVLSERDQERLVRLLDRVRDGLEANAVPPEGRPRRR